MVVKSVVATRVAGDRRDTLADLVDLVLEAGRRVPELHHGRPPVSGPGPASGSLIQLSSRSLNNTQAAIQLAGDHFRGSGS